MFNSDKFVKMKREDWEDIKYQFNELITENKKLSKYKEQDDLLFSYEQTLDELKLKLKKAEAIIETQEQALDSIRVDLMKTKTENKTFLNTIYGLKIITQNQKAHEVYETVKLDMKG